MNGTQLAGSIALTPMATKINRMPALMATMMLFTAADCDTQNSSGIVTSRIIAAATRLTEPVIETWPVPASATWTSGGLSPAGHCRPKSDSRLTKHTAESGVGEEGGGKWH